MNAIITAFWNRTERRLRAGWRIVLFSLLMAALYFCVSFLPDGLPGALILFIVMLLTVFGTWLAGRFIDRRRYADFGWHVSRAWWRDFAFGLALGALLMSLVFAIEFLAGWVVVTDTLHVAEGRNFWLALGGPLLLFVSVGIYEELLYRGYLLRNLSEGFNLGSFGARNAVLLAVLLTSLLFGLAHAANPNASWISTVNIVFAGLLLSAGYVITRELSIPVGLHISWNFFQGHVFGFPVSGTSADPTSFIVIEQGGPQLWTGGNFGPEAGLLGLLAMSIGIALILWWCRRTQGSLRIDQSLAEAPGS